MRAQQLREPNSVYKATPCRSKRLRILNRRASSQVSSPDTRNHVGGLSGSNPIGLGAFVQYVRAFNTCRGRCRRNGLCSQSRVRMRHFVQLRQLTAAPEAKEGWGSFFEGRFRRTLSRKHAGRSTTRRPCF
mmetsp:Transcript_6224/g.18780  ORF Transcript_6224/g.18780 Transcript_6224/m.18780 type:complete len:131 (+) Transcript_6224:879-1271(+)